MTITLADHVIAAAQSPERELHLKLKGATRHRMNQISDKVRHAQRYYLDSSFIKQAVSLSLLSPELLLAGAIKILPINDIIWIEWLEQIRIKELIANNYMTDKEMNYADHASTVGVLIESGDRLTTLSENYQPKFMLGIISQQMKTTAYPLVVHTVGFGWAKDSYDLDTNAAKLILGDRWAKSHPILNNQAWQSLIKYIRPVWWGIPAVTDVNPLNLEKIIENSLVSTTGDLRFILAVLILLTVIEIKSDETWTSQGARAGSNSARLRLPGNVFRTLKIDLPHTILLDKINNYQPPAIPTDRHHRLHDVRAHIAHSRKKGSPICQHKFDQEDLPHFCIYCGYREWPRKAHQRGDGSLGRVFGPRILTSIETNMS